MRFLETRVLPPELWLGVIKLIRRRSLLSLALVNRHLSVIARSELFASFSYKALDPEDYDDGETQLAKESREEQRFIALSQAPAGFVRTWTYTRYLLCRDDDEDEERELRIIRRSEERLQDLFLRLLPAYNGLSTLALTGMPLSGTVLEPVSLLPNLSSLSLSEISKYGPIPRHIHLNIEHFTLQVDVFANSKCLKIDTLRNNLSLNPRRLRSLKVDDDVELSATVANALCEANIKLPLLTSLELVALRVDMGYVYRILPLCPALKTLTVNDLYLIEDDDETDEIDDLGNRENVRAITLNVCPNLTSINGPIGFVTRLTPGRPVTTVGVQYKVESRFFGVIKFLCAMNRSTRMVASLRVDGSPAPLARAIISMLNEYLPYLPALEVCVNEGEHGSKLGASSHIFGPVTVRDPDNPQAISRHFLVNTKSRILAEIAMDILLLPASLRFLSFDIEACDCEDCEVGFLQEGPLIDEIRNNPRFKDLKDLKINWPPRLDKTPGSYAARAPARS